MTNENTNTVDEVYTARLTAALQLEDKTYAKYDAARVALAKVANGTETERALAADEVQYRWSLCLVATERVNAVRATATSVAAYFAK